MRRGGRRAVAAALMILVAGSIAVRRHRAPLDRPLERTRAAPSAPVAAGTDVDAPGPEPREAAPPAEAAEEVVGQVRTSDGTPIRGAWVCPLEDPAAGGPTDVDGLYRVANRGPRVVRARGRGTLVAAGPDAVFAEPGALRLGLEEGRMSRVVAWSLDRIDGGPRVRAAGGELAVPRLEIGHLAPGVYELSLDGGAAWPLIIRSGTTTELRLPAP